MKTKRVIKRIEVFLNPIFLRVLNVVKSSELQMATVLLLGIMASSLMIYHFTLENARADMTTPVVAQQILEKPLAMADDLP